MDDNHEVVHTVGQARQRAQISELVVAYFIRGIRAFDGGRRGPALAARRAWTRPARLPAGRRNHPWDGA